MAEESKVPLVDRVKDRLDIFKKAVDGMIATSPKGYRVTDYDVNATNTIAEFTKEEIANIIISGSSEQLTALSRSYFNASGFYRRIILYYAYLLTYSYIVIPHYRKKATANTKINYTQTLDFVDSLRIPAFSGHAALGVLVDGVYYGSLTKSGDQYSITDLPIAYCRSNFRGYSGLPIVEFDLFYFVTITDIAQRERAFAVLPDGMEKAFNKYNNGAKGASRWFVIPEGQGVCFKMEEARPMFINTITAIDNFQMYRDLEVQKEELETKKILVQHIGTKNDGEFIMEPEEAVELHRGAVSMLQHNPSLDVLTTYAEVTVESLADARQTVSSNLATFQNMIYSESGASANIFAANGNLSLEQSLKNDLSLMMTLAEQISNYYTYLTNKEHAKNTTTYSVVILPISYYNTDEFIEQTYKLATAGYSFILPGLAHGLNQKQFLDLKTLENDVLGLTEVLIPLSTAFTESASDGGAPKKPQTKISDKTIKNTSGGSD